MRAARQLASFASCGGALRRVPRGPVGVSSAPHFQRSPKLRAVSACSGTNAQSAEALVEWIRRSGGSADGVRVKDLDGLDGGSGWGLLAARDAPAGTTLVTLPDKCLFTFDEADTASPLGQLIQKVPEELWTARLGLALLSERAKGQSSAYAPYVSSLPAAFQGVPMFFNGKDIAEIDYPPVASQVKKRCKFLVDFSRAQIAQAQAAAPSLFEGQQVDANSLGWGLAAVSSRAFRLRGPGKPASMLPLIDIANHSFDHNVKVVPIASGGCALTAARDLRGEEPLLLNYGPLSNDFLLIDYGFVIPGNPNDRVAVRFDPGLLEVAREVAGVSAPLGAGKPGASPTGLDAAPWQLVVLRDLGLVGAGARLEVELGGAQCDGVDPRLLGALRVLYATGPAALRGIAQGKHAEALQHPQAGLLSPENEALVLRTALALVAIVLGQFRSTLNDDIELLSKDAAAGGPTGDTRLAVVFRTNKKRLLAETAQRLKARLEGMLKPTAGGAGAEGVRGGAGAGTSQGESSSAAGGGSSSSAAASSSGGAAAPGSKKSKGFGGGAQKGSPKAATGNSNSRGGAEQMGTSGDAGGGARGGGGTAGRKASAQQ